MSDEPTPGPAPEQPLQQIHHSAATARVPDAVGKGVFATGVIVLHGPNEYTIDFVQTLARPGRVAARVILPPAVASQFVIALEQAMEKFTKAHGSLTKDQSTQPAAQPAAQPLEEQKTAAAAESGSQPAEPAAAAPAPSPPPQPAIADIYETLKLPDEMLGGDYSNVVSISYSNAEFCFDFIAQFFPRSAVTARVYMAAPRVPELLGSLKRSIGGR